MTKDRLIWALAGFAQHSSLCQRELGEPSEEGTCVELEPCNCGLQELIELARQSAPPLDDTLITDLEAEIQRLQRALAFWLPHVPSSGSERATRCGDDARLLVGYAGRLDPDAEYLGWITFCYADEPTVNEHSVTDSIDVPRPP